MAKYLEPKVVRRVQMRALANGGSVRPFADGSHSRTVLWDISGRCESPVTVELHGRATDGVNKRVTVQKGKHLPAFVEMETRCRKCSACLRYRSQTWRYRAMEEIRASERTWMVTFTLRPDAYVTLLSKARVSAAKSAVHYEELSPDEQSRRVHRLLYEEVQLWLKRIRKRTGKALRFLAVTESHKSGVPHMHLLIHEQGQAITYRELSGSWGLGFEKFKLVDGPKAAGYVTKYLSKELGSRVRASQFYGQSEAKEESLLKRKRTK